MIALDARLAGRAVEDGRFKGQPVASAGLAGVVVSDDGPPRHSQILQMRFNFIG